MGGSFSKYEPIDPYINEIKSACAKHLHGFEDTFDQMFTDVRVFSLPRESPDQEVEGAIILVRVDRDPSKRPEMKHYFVERDDDRLIKAVLEDCLGMKIGP